MTTTRPTPNAFLASIRNLSPTEKQDAFEKLLTLDEKRFSESLQFNPDEQKEFDTLVSGVSCYFLKFAIDKAEKKPLLRPHLACLLGAISKNVRHDVVSMLLSDRFVKLMRYLPSDKVTELFDMIKVTSGLVYQLISVNYIESEVLSSGTSPQYMKESFCYFLDDILESACKTKNLDRFYAFIREIYKFCYSGIEGKRNNALDFLIIALQKAAQKLSFNDFSSFYLEFKKNHSTHIGNPYYVEGLFRSLKRAMMPLDLKSFSHIENLLLIISPSEFLSKCKEENSVKRFLDYMRAVNIASPVMVNTSEFFFVPFDSNNIETWLNNVLPTLSPETSYADISEFLTLVNRNLSETKENPSTLDPLFTDYCEIIKTPEQIAALIPGDEDKENATTKLVLTKVLQKINRDIFFGINSHLRTRPQRSYLYDMLLENELCLLKKLVNEKSHNGSFALTDILLFFYEAGYFKKFALIRKTFNLSASDMLDKCFLNYNPLSVFVGFVKIFKQEECGVNSDFILSFINDGLHKLSANIKMMDDQILGSDVFCRFLKVANENLCAYEKNKKGEEKYAPYCHSSIKKLLEMIKEKRPCLFERIMSEDVDQNKEISEILREMFFADDKYFLTYYKKVSYAKIPAFFAMLLDNVTELKNFTKEQQDKLDEMILQGERSFLTCALANKSDPDALKIILFRKLSSSALQKFVLEDQRFLSIVDRLGVQKTLGCLENVVEPPVAKKALQYITDAAFYTKDTDKIIELMHTLSGKNGGRKLQTVEQFFLCNIGKITQLPKEKFDVLYKIMPKEDGFKEKLALALLRDEVAVKKQINPSHFMQICTPKQLVGNFPPCPHLFWNYVSIFNSTQHRDALIKIEFPYIIGCLLNMENESGLKDFLDQTKSIFTHDNVFRNAENKEKKDEHGAGVFLETLKTLKQYVVKNNDRILVVAAVQAIYLLETRSPANINDELTALYRSIKNPLSLYSNEVAGCLERYLQTQPQTNRHAVVMKTLTTGAQ